MTKATHNGTCQVCGAEQAVNPSTGKLAKHGYSVEWGYFNGACSGGDELPMQINKDLALSMMLELDNHAERCDANAASTIEHVEITRRVRNYTRRSTVETTIFNREDFEAEFPNAYSGWDGAVKNEIDRLIRLAAYCRNECARIEETIEKVHGTDLLPRQIIDKRTESARHEHFNTPREAYTRQRELEEQGIKSRYMNRNYSPYLIIYENEEDDYEARVRALESEGMTRSDAQAVADAEGLA